MKKILGLIALVVVALIVISLSGNEDDSSYEATIQEKLENQKRYLKFNDQSPFNVHAVEYRDPAYYPIDPDYRVTATVEKINKGEILNVEISDGTVEQYRKYAWLNFSIGENSGRLLVLKPAGFGALPNLFCAFADGTSGESTYGGGRYLDVEIGKSNKLVLDFNLAYNPYCAYVSSYSCPLPPSENLLDFPIFAGEKDFKYN